MPSTVSWPEMGGPTARPTGATLALGDPPKSLNAPEEGLGYHLGWELQDLSPGWASGCLLRLLLQQSL